MRVLVFHVMMLCMNMQQGSARRALLEGSAGEIFREVVSVGVLPADDPRLQDGHEDHDARRAADRPRPAAQDDSGGWVAVDPAAVQSGVVAPMGRQVLELLSESAAWADTFGSLAQAFRRTPAGRARSRRSADCRTSTGSWSPRSTTRSPSSSRPSRPARAGRSCSQQAVERDLRTIERGVHMRTLYQHTARRSKATRDHVNLMLAHGAEVRTLDEFFNRLIVIDRRLAIVPGEAARRRGRRSTTTTSSPTSPTSSTAPGSGRCEYNERGSASDSEIAAEVRQMTVRMLTEGHSDPASAKRVGVSTRTYASYVAALKEEYGVETQVPARVRDGEQRDGVSPRELTGPTAASPIAGPTCGPTRCRWWCSWVALVTVAAEAGAETLTVVRPTASRTAATGLRMREVMEQFLLILGQS